MEDEGEGQKGAGCGLCKQGREPPKITYSKNTDGIHGQLVDVGETHDGGWFAVSIG